MSRIYIAGPMRDKPKWNFPLFDKVRDHLIEHGQEPISPADIDRQNGQDEHSGDPFNYDPQCETHLSVIKRDLDAILTCDALVLLPGWEESVGASAEKHLADWMDIPVWYWDPRCEYVVERLLYSDAERPPSGDSGRDQAPSRDLGDGRDVPIRSVILREAESLVCGDRNAQYGPPTQDFSRTAKLWSAWKGVDFEPREVAIFQILLKTSREKHQKKRDNWTDMAGYSACGGECAES